MDKPCAHCGEPMTTRTRARARFCSSPCRLEFHYSRLRASVIANRPLRNCKECGASIPPEADGNVRFCSVQCGRRFNQRVSRERRQSQSLAMRMSRTDTCRRCGSPIPVDRRGGARYCSNECRRHEINRVVLERAPAAHRQRLYGLSPAEYEGMLAAQGNRCAICKTETPRGKGWQVDHDHASGRIRGILCTNCNSGLGRFIDNPGHLRAAADYLEGRHM